MRDKLAAIGIRLRASVPGVVQLAGIAVFVAGAFTITLTVGLFVAGAALAFVGWAMDTGGDA